MTVNQGGSVTILQISFLAATENTSQCALKMFPFRKSLHPIQLRQNFPKNVQFKHSVTRKTKIVKTNEGVLWHLDQKLILFSVSCP